MLGTEAKDYSHFAEAQPAAPDFDAQGVVIALVLAMASGHRCFQLNRPASFVY
jgi:hypothetical protein